MLNDAMLVAGGSYAVARTLDATISTLQSSQLSAGVVSIGIGQMLNPVSDLINRFSDIMVVAFTSLSLQKMLLLIMSSPYLSVIVALGGLCYLFAIWKRAGTRLHTVCASIFKVLVILRFAVLLSVLASLLVNQVFLNQQIKENEQRISQVSHSVSANSATAPAQQQDSGIFSFMDNWSEFAKGLSNQKQKLTELVQQVEDSITNILLLISLYIIKTLILPLLFLYIVRKAISGLFRAV